MENLIADLRRARPDATDSSLKAYAATLRTLMKKADKKDLAFLKDHKKTQEVFEKLSVPTRRNYYNAIIVYLRGTDDGNEDLKKAYREKRDELNRELKKKDNAHERSDKQRKNWITQEEYDKVWKKYDDEAKSLLKREPKDKRCFGDLQKWVLLSLYKWMPPVRNDFHNVQVVSPAKAKKLNESHNYLITGKPYKFVAYDYKTSKTFGKNEISIPPELEAILKKWLKCNKSGWLLTIDGINPMNSNQLTKMLTGIFKSETGKSVGATMLRHVFATEKYGDLLEDAKKLGHTPEQLLNYIVK